jgi:plastocyanin
MPESLGSMRMKTTVVLCLGLLAAGCGGASQPEPVAAPPPADTRTSSPSPAPADDASAAEPRRVDPRSEGFEIAYGEYAITTETNAIRPGRVSLVVTNGGKLTHGFEMKSDSEGSHSGRGRGGDRFKIEKPTFGPGGSFKLSLTLAPGVYELECYVGNHEALGMRTILRVSGDAPLVEQDTKPTGDSVEVRGFAFGPRTLEVTAGTQVTWRNSDPTQHTVTSKDGAFGSEPLAPSGTFAAKFDQPGEYRYFCAIHPTMEGVVRVTS